MNNDNNMDILDDIRSFYEYQNFTNPILGTDNEILIKMRHYFKDLVLDNVVNGDNHIYWGNSNIFYEKCNIPYVSNDFIFETTNNDDDRIKLIEIKKFLDKCKKWFDKFEITRGDTELFRYVLLLDKLIHNNNELISNWIYNRIQDTMYNTQEE